MASIRKFLGGTRGSRAQRAWPAQVERKALAKRIAAEADVDRALNELLADRPQFRRSRSPGADVHDRPAS